jgi:hypothetical protein
MNIVPEGIITTFFRDRYKTPMCRIRPFDGGRILTADNEKEHPVGTSVRFGWKRRIGHNADFTTIEGLATREKKDLTVRKDASETCVVLCYDPKNEFVKTAAVLSDELLVGRFGAVDDFYEKMQQPRSQEGPRYWVGCVVLNDLDVQLNGYPNELIPDRILSLSPLIGGATIVDEIANQFGYTVFVNKPFEREYEFLKDIPGVEELPFTIDERVNRILMAMGRKGI